MKTIFDIGMHEGFDAEFYLRKGFRVVGVEANPRIESLAAARLAAWLERGELTIVGKAIGERSEQTVPFFIRDDKDEWSSVHRHAAERDGLASLRIDVTTVTVDELFARFGVPHYLKCDIEGADNLLLSQLARAPEKPRFVSVEGEAEGAETLDLLAAAGYRRFQIVNQSWLKLFSPPHPPREGRFAAQVFHGRMSGLFGEELDPRHWSPHSEARRRLDLWQRLAARRADRLTRFVLKRYGKAVRRTWLIDGGWIDIHARRDDGRLG